MRNSVFTMLMLALLLPFIGGTYVIAAEGEEAQRQLTGEILPLLKQFCFECHSGEKPEGSVNLGKYSSTDQILMDRKVWLNAVGKIQSKEMPPAEHMPHPTDAQRKHISEFLLKAANNLDCSGGVDPGRVTIRRLNRREYRNTVRDLLSVDYQPSEEFPGDDTGYGFDNIADVISLPPILLEKYLAAAEAITEKAIDGTGGKMPLDATLVGKQLSGAGDAMGDKDRILATSGTCSTQIAAPVDGMYEIRLTGYGHQAGEDPVKVKLLIDDKEVGSLDIPVTQNEAKSFSVETEVPAGSHTLAVRFINDLWLPDEPNPERRDRNLIVQKLQIRGPLSGEGVGLSESHKRIVTVRPGGKKTRREATREVLRPLASRAFRRPVTDEELDRLTKVADAARRDGDTYEQSLQVATQAILISPHFLFRMELDPVGQEGQPRNLNDFELATRLSYFLWSSMPDEELYKLAEAGKLREGDQLEKQVRRMLADPKSQALIENFGGQWLELRSLDIRTPDLTQFSEYNPALRNAMRRETELFLGSIIREDRSVFDLLSADFTFVNEPLAKLYGIGGVTGEEFQRVSLAGTPRGGILTQASMLTITSNPSRTSPVKRGKWILENILGTPPPPPPPNVPELKENEAAVVGTLREKMEQHRANPICASCHQRMDPLGFALENFDAIGRFREQDHGAAIDNSGKLPSGEEFRGAADLRKILISARSGEFLQCLSEKLLTYALGRGLEYKDQCSVDAIKAEAAAHDHKFTSLVLGIVKSDPFQKVGAKPLVK